MPILIKDYTWEQTEKYITIKLPLKGNEKHVDLLTSNRYIKAFNNPYLFEIFLWKEIDGSKSDCVISDTEIIFELCKAELGLWDKLEDEIDKSEKMILKKKYLDEMQEEAQNLDKVKADKNGELKRQAVREQISIDSQFRERIENIKKMEEQKALTEMNLWENANTSIDKDALVKPEKEKLKKNNCPIDDKAKNVSNIKRHTSKSVENKINLSQESKISVQPTIPLPRKCQSVNIEFTEREFLTPSRESKAKEEEEWLAKEAEARRSVGFNDDDLRPEEKNPQWLKDKGDEFFKAKNFRGAISAYSFGIKLSKNFASLYANRAAAHFALDNYKKAIDDSTTAIELMTPICEVNRVIRAKCIARRGASLCKLNMFREGKIELQAAIKLLPEDKSLENDLKAVEAKLCNNL